jgi:hypothetical protein
MSSRVLRDQDAASEACSEQSQRQAAFTAFVPAYQLTHLRACLQWLQAAQACCLLTWRPANSFRSDKGAGLPSISVAGKGAAPLSSSFTAQHHRAGSQAHARQQVQQVQQAQQAQQAQQQQPGGLAQLRAARNPGHTADDKAQATAAATAAAVAAAVAAAAGLDTGQGSGDDSGLNCQLPGLPEALAGTFAAEFNAMAGTLDRSSLPPISASFALAGKQQPIHASHGHGHTGHTAAAAAAHGALHSGAGQQGAASAGSSTSRRMSQGLPAVTGAAGGQQGLLHSQGALGPEPSASKLGPAGGKANSRSAAGAQQQQPGHTSLAAGKVGRAHANAASTLAAGLSGFGGALQANLSVSSIFKQATAAGAAKGGKQYVSPYSQRGKGVY